MPELQFYMLSLSDETEEWRYFSFVDEIFLEFNIFDCVILRDKTKWVVSCWQIIVRMNWVHCVNPQLFSLHCSCVKHNPSFEWRAEPDIDRASGLLLLKWWWKQLLQLLSVEPDVKEDIVTVGFPFWQGYNIPLQEFFRIIYSIMQEHTEQKILIYLFILLKKTIETRGYVIQSGYPSKRDGGVD